MKDSSKNLIFNMSNEEYHGGNHSYSSSQLKTILQDPELFYRKYITKELPKDESPAFDVGTYFHCAVLEGPAELEKQCAVFSEGIRRGPKWEAFKELHKGKAIITATELKQANTLIEAVGKSTVATKLLFESSVEVSAYADLYVLGKDVYTVIKGAVNKLQLVGWVVGEIDLELLEEFALKIRIKVRADSIRIGEGVISDLKSTTGNCKDLHKIKQKIADYGYGLSTSLYLDIFTAVTGDLYHTFAWIFASKDIGNCKTWIASERQIQVGRKQWKNAIVILANCINSEWKFEDEIGECEPIYYEVGLLSEEF
jgi:hypothetical protein